MAPWSFLNINYVPLSLGVVFSIGLATCYVIAVSCRHVSPYVPFISETGGKYPEAGIFSIFLYLTVTIGLFTMFVRYMIVSEVNNGNKRTIDILNKISIVIGFIALMGMVVVAAYPVTAMLAGHSVGAYVLFIGTNIYAPLQTWLSFKMPSYHNGRVVCYIRLVITALSIVSLVSMLAIVPIASKEWSSEEHDHWSGSKVPTDKGFGLILGAAVAEWAMAIFFLAYYFTFVQEFGRFSIHLKVKFIAKTFNEEPRDVNTTTDTARNVYWLGTAEEVPNPNPQAMIV